MSVEFKNALIETLTNFIKDNETFNKKELLNVIRTNFNNKEKKPLNAYQLFMKEQYPILSQKDDKKNSKEIMADISKLWKLKKEGKEEIKEEVKEEVKEKPKEVKKPKEKKK